jgi:hypothetical protein
MSAIDGEMKDLRIRHRHATVHLFGTLYHLVEVVAKGRLESDRVVVSPID